jgi:hypothetical protein
MPRGVRGQSGLCHNLVETHQPRIASHVSGYNSCQSALNPLIHFCDRDLQKILPRPSLQ